MRLSRLAAFQIVCCGLGSSACRATVAGRYELDLEETKVCVAQAARDNSADAKLQDETLEKLFSNYVLVRK